MKKDTFRFKAALLSISLILVAGPAISAIIPLMKEVFVDRTLAEIELIATIPNFGILIFVLLGTPLTKFLGEKKTVMVGLSVALISGLVPVFSDNYLVILISRFVFGAGVGLFNALAMSLILELYEGQTRATMMGLQSAMGSIGSTILSLGVGFLAKYGWSTAFWVYAITAIPLVLFGLFVHLAATDTTEKEVVENAPKEKINGAVIMLSVFSFFLYCFFFTLMLKMATFLGETGIGTLENAAAILSGVTLIGIVVGVIYGKIFGVLKNFVLPVGVSGMAIGFLLIATASNLPIVIGGALLAGISFSLSAPYIFMLVGEIAPPNSANLSTAILLVGINLGVFLSPTIMNFLSALFNATTAKGGLIIGGVGIGVLAVGSLVLLFIRNKKAQKVVE